MAHRLWGLRVIAYAGGAIAWAVACGGGADTVTGAPGPECLVYAGIGNVAPPPDGAAACPKGPCNFQTQSGCSSTQTCGPHYDAASDSVVPACVATGSQAEGEPCDNSATQICAPGLLCADGVCAHPCCGGDYLACGAGKSCIRSATIFKTSSGKELPYDEGLGTCAKVGTCDVLDPSSCSGDTKRPVCRIVDPTGAVACTPHATGGDRALGDDCDEAHQCAAGLHCAGNSNDDSAVQTKCVRLCAWGSCSGTPACGKNEGLCVHFLHDPDGVGECTVGWRGKGTAIDGGLPSSTKLDASTAN